MKGAFTLYTVGYEDASLPALIRLLQEYEIERLVDVRQTAFSRKRGFTAMALFEATRKVGIAYEHVRGLGNPPEIRGLWQNDERERGRDLFRKYLLSKHTSDVQYLLQLAAVSPTAILCREKDPDECHRSVVAAVAADMSGEPINVKHL